MSDDDKRCAVCRQESAELWHCPACKAQVCPACAGAHPVHIYKCLRCGHTWRGRTPRRPRNCPECTSRYWHTAPAPRKVVPAEPPPAPADDDLAF